jgi:hypothetical protein
VTIVPDKIFPPERRRATRRKAYLGVEEKGEPGHQYLPLVVIITSWHSIIMDIKSWPKETLPFTLSKE